MFRCGISPSSKDNENTRSSIRPCYTMLHCAALCVHDGLGMTFAKAAVHISKTLSVSWHDWLILFHPPKAVFSIPDDHSLPHGAIHPARPSGAARLVPSDLSDVHARGGAVGLAEGAAHAAREAVRTGAGPGQRARVRQATVTSIRGKLRMFLG